VPTLSHGVLVRGAGSEVTVSRDLQLHGLELEGGAQFFLEPGNALIIDPECQGCDVECEPGGTCSTNNQCVCKPGYSGELCDVLKGPINPAVEAPSSQTFSTLFWSVLLLL